jgi:hypothetical protein
MVRYYTRWQAGRIRDALRHQVATLFSGPMPDKDVFPEKYKRWLDVNRDAFAGLARYVGRMVHCPLRMSDTHVFSPPFPPYRRDLGVFKRMVFTVLVKRGKCGFALPREYDVNRTVFDQLTESQEAFIWLIIALEYRNWNFTQQAGIKHTEKGYCNPDFTVLFRAFKDLVHNNRDDPNKVEWGDEAGRQGMSVGGSTSCFGP